MNTTLSSNSEGTPDQMVELARKLAAKVKLVGSDNNPMIDKVSPPRYPDIVIADTERLDVTKDLPCPEPMAQSRKPADLGHQLRRAILRSGLTRNQIAKQSGLSYGVIHGFMAGTKDLLLETASRIATILGLELSELQKPHRTQNSTRGDRSQARRMQSRS